MYLHAGLFDSCFVTFSSDLYSHVLIFLNYIYTSLFTIIRGAGGA